MDLKQIKRDMVRPEVDGFFEILPPIL